MARGVRVRVRHGDNVHGMRAGVKSRGREESAGGRTMNGGQRQRESKRPLCDGFCKARRRRRRRRGGEGRISASGGALKPHAARDREEEREGEGRQGEEKDREELKAKRGLGGLIVASASGKRQQCFCVA